MTSVTYLVVPAVSVNVLLDNLPCTEISVPFLTDAASSSAVLPQATNLCQSVCFTFSPFLLVKYSLVARMSVAFLLPFSRMGSGA